MLYNCQTFVKTVYTEKINAYAATGKGTLMPPPVGYIRRGVTQKYFMKPEKKEI